MHTPIEETVLVHRVEALVDRIDRLVRHWDGFDRDTIGKQLVRSTDSIGANLVEGDARRSDADSIRFFRYARSSGREARWWMRRVAARNIEPPEDCDALVQELTECVKMVNGLIRYRTQVAVKVSESRAPYDDPYLDDAFSS